MSSTARTDQQRRLRYSQTRMGVLSLFSWQLSLCLLACVIAYLPVLVAYFSQLWKRDYYQFFPFAIATTVGLAVTRSDFLPALRAGKFRWGLRLIAGIAALAFACWWAIPEFTMAVFCIVCLHGWRSTRLMVREEQRLFARIPHPSIGNCYPSPTAFGRDHYSTPANYDLRIGFRCTICDVD